jgi:hypothetical protein
LSGLHLARNPVLVTGLRDMAALAVGLAGLITIGPLELFMPQAAAEHFGPLVWLLLCGLYALCVILLLLVMRPRLVIYNVDAEQLRPLLVAAVQQLDDEPRWAGECLALPRLGVQAYVQAGGGLLRYVELVAAGPGQNLEGWRRLEQALSPQLRAFPVQPNPWGGVFLGTALFLTLLTAGRILLDPPALLAAFREKFIW